MISRCRVEEMGNGIRQHKGEVLKKTLGMILGLALAIGSATVVLSANDEKTGDHKAGDKGHDKDHDKGHDKKDDHKK